MLDDFNLFIMLRHFFNDANASMTSTINLFLNNKKINVTLSPNGWVVYMFFFAESTLPGTHRRDVIFHAFWKMRAWVTAGGKRREGEWAVWAKGRGRIESIYVKKCYPQGANMACAECQKTTFCTLFASETVIFWHNNYNQDSHH